MKSKFFLCVVNHYDSLAIQLHGCWYTFILLWSAWCNLCWNLEIAFTDSVYLTQCFFAENLFTDLYLIPCAFETMSVAIWLYSYRILIPIYYFSFNMYYFRCYLSANSFNSKSCVCLWNVSDILSLIRHSVCHYFCLCSSIYEGWSQSNASYFILLA